MARNYAALPHEYGREMEALSDAEFGRLCRALLEYSENGTPIALNGNERFYANRVMMQEDRFQESYSTDARRDAGRRGAEARWNGKDGKAILPYSKNGKAIWPYSKNGKNGYTETETKTNTETKGDITPYNPPSLGEKGRKEAGMDGNRHNDGSSPGDGWGLRADVE